MFPLKNILKHLIILLAGLIIIAASFFSCKGPDDNQDILPEDPLSYTSVNPAVYFWVASMADCYSFEHFFKNNKIYLVTTGERYNIELAQFGINADFYGASPFYESENKLDIKSAIDLSSGDFLAVGEIYNETPWPYSNPFYKTSGPEYDIRIFDWNGRNNSFEGVTMYSGDYIGALFLARDEIGSIGAKYPLYEYSMVYTEHIDDTARVSLFPVDSCYIDYYDKPSTFTERFVGMKIDAVTEDTGIVTHMFYFENAGGNQVEYNLGNMFPGRLVPEDVYYENVNPLKIYRWSYKSKNVLTLEKYSHTGDKEYSRDIKLFEDTLGIEAVCQVEKSADHQFCLIYGYFQQNIDPGPPVFKGNFLIKMDDEGNVTNSVIWDEHFNGKYAGEPHVQDIGDDRFVFLYSFDFLTGNDYFIFERIDLDSLARM